jgi:hypothetical protein
LTWKQLSWTPQAFELKGEVGKLIDAATNEGLIGPDWQMNMQICEKVNTLPKEGWVFPIHFLTNRQNACLPP